MSNIISFNEFESIVNPNPGLDHFEKTPNFRNEKFSSNFEFLFSMIGGYEYSSEYRVYEDGGKFRPYYKNDFINISYDPVFFIPSSMELRDYMPVISIDDSNWLNFYSIKDGSYQLDDDIMNNVNNDMKKFAERFNTLIALKLRFTNSDSIESEWNSVDSRASFFKKIGFSEFFMADTSSVSDVLDLLKVYNRYTKCKAFEPFYGSKIRYLVYKNDIGEKYLNNNKKILERYIIEKPYIDNLRRFTYMSNFINPDIM